jgi:elongation factor P
MMLKATDIRRGMVITIDGVNFVVLDFAHHTPGNLRAMVQTKLRNMNNGSLIEKRLRSVDQIEVPYVETKEYEYLYSASDDHVFMDTETYDQLSFSAEIIGTAMDYLLPNSRVMVKYINDKPVSIEIPDFVELAVSDTPPALTGLKVQVPPFVKPGEKIRIDTRTGEYLERVK